jgi:hypothetical protein
MILLVIKKYEPTLLCTTLSRIICQSNDTDSNKKHHLQSDALVISIANFIEANYTNSDKKNHRLEFGRLSITQTILLHTFSSGIIIE